VIGDQLEAAAFAEASAYARFGVTSRRDLPSSDYGMASKKADC
jgi:hypothetical protein